MSPERSVTYVSGRSPLNDLAGQTERQEPQKRRSPVTENPQPRSTAEWYRYSLKAFQPVLDTEFDTGGPFKQALAARIGQLQREGHGYILSGLRWHVHTGRAVAWRNRT